MTARKNNFDPQDYRWGADLEGVMAGSVVIDPEWQPFGYTGEFHPLGPGHRYIQGRAYSNGVYRQCVERPDGNWDDCMIVREPAPGGLMILQQRLVVPAVAARLANANGVVLMGNDGNPIPFTSSVPTKEIPVYVPRVANARKPVGAGYDLKMFVAEIENEDLRDLMTDLSDFFTDLFGHWYVGEKAQYGVAYPYFYSGNVEYFPAFFRTSGIIELQYQWIAKRSPFTSKPIFEQFTRKMAAIFGQSAGSNITGRPVFQMAVLLDPEALRNFKDAMAWFLQVALKNSDEVPS
jgi:hypothetical protein